jgi:hypothetical protein
MNTLSAALNSKSVRRNDKYKDVVNLLVYGSLDGKSGGNKSFDNIKDLIIFAAMVGKHYEKTEEVDLKNNTAITVGTFSGSGSTRGSRVGQHDVIFMFGLLLQQDIAAIRDENISKSIEAFERYSNGGLSMVYDWLVNSAWNPLIIEQVLLDTITSTTPAGIIVDGGNPFT